MNQSLSVNYESIKVLEETLGEHCILKWSINRFPWRIKFLSNKKRHTHMGGGSKKLGKISVIYLTVKGANFLHEKGL